MAGPSVCRSLGLGGVCGFGTCVVDDNSGVLGRTIVHIDCRVKVLTMSFLTGTCEHRNGDRRRGWVCTPTETYSIV